MARSEWNSTDVPEEGEIVCVLAADNIGQYEIPFPVVFRDDSLVEPSHGRRTRRLYRGMAPIRQCRITQLSRSVRLRTPLKRVVVYT